MRGLEPIVRAYVRWVVAEKGRLDSAALAVIWPIAVGRVWAERTCPKALRGDRLEVAVPDGVWLAELRYQSERVLQRLNELLPDEVAAIDSLRLTVGEVPAWQPRPQVEGTAVERVPLTDEQRAALEGIVDPALREVVASVIERDTGRLHDKGPEASEGTE